MRKHQKRWIAVAGATAISLAGLGVLGSTAAAADRPQPTGPAAGQQNPSHILDGFDIGHLPPSLDRYGVRARSVANGNGERSSSITWVEGGDTVHGKVSILRAPYLKALSDLQERNYTHLAPGSLKKVDNEGKTAYLSEGTGDIFWLEEPGLAVAVYLRPEKWTAEELTAFAASVEHRHATASSAS